MNDGAVDDGIRRLARELVREWLPPPDVRRAAIDLEGLEHSVERVVAAAIRRDRLAQRLRQQV